MNSFDSNALVLQFIPSHTAPVMTRFLGRLAGGVVAAVIDLEDGLWDVCDAERTRAMKASAREQVFKLCAAFPKALTNTPIFLRLNPVDSPEFASDLSVARALSEACGWFGLLLPKTASGRDYAEAQARLAEAQVKYRDLVPMAETEAALGRLPTFAAEVAARGATSLIFGFYDHCLESGEWPFPAPDESVYWERARRVSDVCRERGLRYIHPPIAVLHDTELLGAAIRRLRAWHGPRFGIFSGGPSQTPLLVELCQSLDEPAEASGALLEAASTASPLSLGERLDLARKTLAVFEGHRHRGVSFTSDARQARFIPPHEHLAARRFLEQAGHA